MPAAVGLWLTSEALVSFLFQGRSFTPDDVSQTALAVVGYSVGLIGLIALKIVAPAFYARKDIRTPVKTAFWSLVVVQLVNLVSVPLFSHAGLALSVGVGSVFNAGTLLIILMRRGIYTPLPGWAKAVLRIALATLLMGAGLWYGQTFVSWTTMPWLMRAGGVLAMVAAAAVAYFAVMFACGWRLSDLRSGDDLSKMRNLEKGKGADSGSAPFPFLKSVRSGVRTLFDVLFLDRFFILVLAEGVDLVEGEEGHAGGPADQFVLAHGVESRGAEAVLTA